MARQRKAVADELMVNSPVEPLTHDVMADTGLLPAPTGYRVAVGPQCPWPSVRSAGADFDRAGALVAAEDPRLPELRACEWLTVTPID